MRVGRGLHIRGLAAGIHGHRAIAAGVGSRHKGDTRRQVAHRYIMGGKRCHICIGRSGSARNVGDIRSCHMGGGAGSRRIAVAVRGLEGELVVRSLAGSGHAVVAEVAGGTVQGQGVASHRKGVVAIGALCAGHFCAVVQAHGQALGTVGTEVEGYAARYVVAVGTRSRSVDRQRGHIVDYLDRHIHGELVAVAVLQLQAYLISFNRVCTSARMGNGRCERILIRAVRRLRDGAVFAASANKGIAARNVQGCRFTGVTRAGKPVFIYAQGRQCGGNRQAARHSG